MGLSANALLGSPNLSNEASAWQVMQDECAIGMRPLIRSMTELPSRFGRPSFSATATCEPFSLKSAVEALAFFDLRAEVASTWREAGRGAQEVAVEEGLKRAR